MLCNGEDKVQVIKRILETDQAAENTTPVNKSIERK